MLRGRHRGLPVAIDRAVLLPAEYGKEIGRHEDDGGDDNLADATPAGANAGLDAVLNEKHEQNGVSNEEGDLRQRRTNG